MSVQSEIDRINGAKSTLAANIESAGFTAGEGASIVQLASTVGDAFTDTSSRLATVNGTSGTISTQLDTLDGTKTAIRDAIVAKGVDIPEGTVFRDYASKIGEVRSGGFSDTATISLITPYGYSNREINYIDESFAKVSNTSDSEIQIPVPQIVYIRLAGSRETSHKSSGNAETLLSSLVDGVYYVYGDATFTASR